MTDPREGSDHYSDPHLVDAALATQCRQFGRVCACMLVYMPQLRIRECARVLGVSEDTVRRLVDAGTLTADLDTAGRKVVDGVVLAAYAKDMAQSPDGLHHSSARNHFRGLVTGLVIDQVMAQVEMQCGPHRVVSLMSAEAVRDLGLEIGTVATAVIKSTNVVVETVTP